MLIHEAKIEFCVVAVYADGNAYCIAKFMHEEDARKYKRSRKKESYREYRVYERREKNGGVEWIRL